MDPTPPLVFAPTQLMPMYVVPSSFAPNFDLSWRSQTPIVAVHHEDIQWGKKRAVSMHEPGNQQLAMYPLSAFGASGEGTSASAVLTPPSCGQTPGLTTPGSIHDKQTPPNQDKQTPSRTVETDLLASVGEFSFADFASTTRSLDVSTSLLEVTQTLSQLGITSQDQIEAGALGIIEELRKEPTDRQVRARIMRFSHSICTRMVSALDRVPSLIAELCLSERGNIVCHLIEKLGHEQCFFLIKWASENFMILSKDRSGCIALPRILAFVKESQRDVFFEQTMKNINDLFCDQFGNYVVKYFIQCGEPKYIFEIVGFLCKSEDSLQAVTTNKFGSHLVDEILRNGTPEHLLALISPIFSNAKLLRILSHDSYANYCLQNAFKALRAKEIESEVQSWCVSQTIAVVASSPYRQNIMKHALMQHSKKRHGRSEK